MCVSVSDGVDIQTAMKLHSQHHAVIISIKSRPFLVTESSQTI